MDKAQRKRRAREMKRKAKLAKRAKREAETNTQDVQKPGAADTGAVAVASTDASEASGPTEKPDTPQASDTGDLSAKASAKAEGPSTNSGQAPRATPPTQDDLHRAHAKYNWAEADMLEGELAAKLGDDEAVELLTKAARALGDVIDYVQDLLERVPKDQVAEAIRIQNAPRTFGDKSRNGANPVVQLLNILLRAKGLMIRVVKQTNPELAKRMKAKL